MSKSFVKRGGLCVALVLVTLTLLFNANCSTAATLLKINSSNSFFQCSRGSSIDDCLGEGLDFVMGSKAVSVRLDIGKTLDAGKPAVDCGRGKSKKSCLPNPNDSKVAEHCYAKGVYTQNRGCKK